MRRGKRGMLDGEDWRQHGWRGEEVNGGASERRESGCMWLVAAAARRTWRVGKAPMNCGASSLPRLKDVCDGPDVTRLLSRTHRQEHAVKERPSSSSRHFRHLLAQHSKVLQFPWHGAPGTCQRANARGKVQAQERKAREGSSRRNSHSIHTNAHMHTHKYAAPAVLRGLARHPTHLH